MGKVPEEALDAVDYKQDSYQDSSYNHQHNHIYKHDYGFQDKTRENINEQLNREDDKKEHEKMPQGNGKTQKGGGSTKGRTKDNQEPVPIQKRAQPEDPTNIPSDNETSISSIRAESRSPGLLARSSTFLPSGLLTSSRSMSQTSSASLSFSTPSSFLNSITSYNGQPRSLSSPTSHNTSISTQESSASSASTGSGTLTNTSTEPMLTTSTITPTSGNASNSNSNSSKATGTDKSTSDGKSSIDSTHSASPTGSTGSRSTDSTGSTVSRSSANHTSTSSDIPSSSTGATTSSITISSSFAHANLSHTSTMHEPHPTSTDTSPHALPSGVSDSQQYEQQQQHEQTKKIVGSVVGAVGGLMMIGLVAFILFARYKKSKKRAAVLDSDSRRSSLIFDFDTDAIGPGPDGPPGPSGGAGGFVNFGGSGYRYRDEEGADYDPNSSTRHIYSPQRGAKPGSNSKFGTISPAAKQKRSRWFIKGSSPLQAAQNRNSTYSDYSDSMAMEQNPMSSQGPFVPVASVSPAAARLAAGGTTVSNKAKTGLSLHSNSSTQSHDVFYDYDDEDGREVDASGAAENPFSNSASPEEDFDFINESRDVFYDLDDAREATRHRSRKNNHEQAPSSRQQPSDQESYYAQPQTVSSRFVETGSL